MRRAHPLDCQCAGYGTCAQRDAVAQHVAAADAYGAAAVDECYGVSLGVEWCSVDGEPVMVAPDICADYRWTDDTWWPAGDGGRLLRALADVDPRALTKL